MAGSSPADPSSTPAAARTSRRYLVPDPAVVDDDVLARAHAQGGLLRPAEAGGLRAARRRGLVLVQPGVVAAATQPLSTAQVVTAVSMSATGDYWFAGRAAAWLYGTGDEPAVVDVAVRDVRQLVLAPPVRVRRLAPSLLHGTRTVDGRPLVGLETAVVQCAEDRSDLLAPLVEAVLRRRMTTHERLLRTCRRGVAGSTALRHVLDVVADGDLELWKRRLRQSLVAAGVTGLRSEVPVHSTAGATAYLDLLHDATRNAVEVDGWLSHSERGRFLSDRRRDRWVRRELGIATTRVAVDELRADLEAVVRELLPIFSSRASAGGRSR